MTDVIEQPELDLAEELASPPDVNRRKERCIVADAIAEHTQGDAIAAAIDNPKWTAPALQRVLHRRGINMSTTAIRNHRHGVCACRDAKEL